MSEPLPAGASLLPVGGSLLPLRDPLPLGDGSVTARRVLEVIGPTLTAARRATIERVVAARTFAVAVLLEGLTDAGNVAAVLRSAEGLGFGAVHILPEPAFGLAGTLRAARRCARPPAPPAAPTPSTPAPTWSEVVPRSPGPTVQLASPSPVASVLGPGSVPAAEPTPGRPPGVPGEPTPGRPPGVPGEPAPPAQVGTSVSPSAVPAPPSAVRPPSAQAGTPVSPSAVTVPPRAVAAPPTAGPGAAPTLPTPAGRPPPPPARVTQGAEKWLFTRQWADGAACVAHLRACGVRVVATALTEGSMPLAALDLSTPVAIAFGNEHRGVSDALAAAADQVVTVPMAGFTRSFNVSVAAAVVLAHVRDRLPAEMSGWQLTAAERLLLTAHYYLISQPHAAALLRRSGTTPSAPTARARRRARRARRSRRSRPARQTRPARQARPARPARQARPSRPARQARPARRSRPARQARPARRSRQARPARSRRAQPAQPGKRAQPAQPGKRAQPAQPGKRAQPPSPASAPSPPSPASAPSPPSPASAPSPPSPASAPSPPSRAQPRRV